MAGVPSAVNTANRIHIENGREPNAGVSIMTNIITMVLLWWIAGLGLKHFFGFKVAIISVILVSLILFILSIRSSIISNREYEVFINEHKANSKAEQNDELNEI